MFGKAVRHVNHPNFHVILEERIEVQDAMSWNNDRNDERQYKLWSKIDADYFMKCLADSMALTISISGYGYKSESENKQVHKISEEFANSYLDTQPIYEGMGRNSPFMTIEEARESVRTHNSRDWMFHF